MSFVNIHFNSDKCRIITYNPSNELRSTLYLPAENSEDNSVEVSGINDTVKYLGILLEVKN
jgi:hypothetical protein